MTTDETFNLSMSNLVEKVLGWGTARGLHDTTDLRPQLIKLTEELGEIAAGVARHDPDRVLDGVGDLLVVLINFGAVYSRYVHIQDVTAQLELERDFLMVALATAWREIRDREGVSRDGVFIKNEKVTLDD